MSELVIREVAKDVWIFSVPFNRFGLIPFGGRSTAIKLSNGGVWVLASTPLDKETKDTLDRLGPVQYIVSGDSHHHMFLGDYKKEYPSAKLIAPAEAIVRHNDKNLKFDGAWGTDAEGTTYGFEEDITACYFPGFQNKDVAFFHHASKSVIEADLVFNLPGTEQYSKSKSSAKSFLGSGFHPSSWFHAKFSWGAGVDKDAMRRDIKTVLTWDFTRIIPCHGDVIEGTGKQAWSDAFKNYLV